LRDPAGHYTLRDATGWVFALLIATNGEQERLDATVAQLNDDLHTCATLRATAAACRPRLTRQDGDTQP
jgi:hypothetical protein